MAKVHSSSTFASSSTTLVQSPFHDAVKEFDASYKKKKQPTFIKDYHAGVPTKPGDVQDALTLMEKESSNKKLRRVMRAATTAMVDYSGILDTLCQADPMPSALVWGGLKVVVDCFRRYTSLQDILKSRLERLTAELSRLTAYEELFGHSTEMQMLLKDSYLNILRFWAKVEDYCNQHGIVRAVKGLTSAALNRLDAILEDLKQNGEDIAKLVPIIQERVNRDEREDAAEERRKAGIARDETSAWIIKERKIARMREVRQWIRGSLELNESNFRHQRRNESNCNGTCKWILQDPNFVDWNKTAPGQRTLWLKGDPGCGKSVTCSFTVKHIRETAKSAGIAFHYYSFDERVSSLNVFRSIAEQLYDQLYAEQDDVSDALHEIITRSSNNANSIREAIRMLVQELSQTYIFLDGLDEECTESDRWHEAKDIVSFLESLAKEDDSTVKLWCSSQDHHDISQLVADFPTITLDASKNSSDIKAFCAAVLPALDAVDVDPGTAEVILRDLEDRACGNFLWASLMAKTVSNASSLKDLQEELHEGLPADVEKYYARKLKTVKPENRKIVSQILSCIVYAKRPLHIEEICEFIGAYSTDYGHDLNQGAPLFSNKVLELCSPLVQVQDIGKRSSKSVCTLSHAAVKKFLMKNPRILNDQGSSFSITPGILGHACLKYLAQPRYGHLLKRDARHDTFVTEDGADIMKHHILAYAAKYWDKHLEQLDYSDELSGRVEKFVTSKAFRTTLQVQCLFVGGLFKFWQNTREPDLGPNLRRTFPNWFCRRNHCGDQLSKAYYSAIGEWGYYLDEYASSTGPFPGELDRILWPTLGSDHFLHKTPSRIKSFPFKEKEKCCDEGFCRYFEGISNNGDEVQIFRVRRLPKNSSLMEINCQRWTLSKDHRPKLKQTQLLNVPAASFGFYERPLRTMIIGRPSVVSCSSDHKLLRIGSQLYRSSDSGEYARVPGLPTSLDYYEEIASNGRYIAIATRRRVSEVDLLRPSGLDDTAFEDLETTFSETMNMLLTTLTEQSSSRSSSDDQQDRSSDASSESTNSSRTSLSIEEPEEDTKAAQLENEVLGSDFESDASSIASMSARESWSEGSTDVLSDETDDDDQWNDYESDDDSLAIEDRDDFSLDEEEEEAEKAGDELLVDDTSSVASGELGDKEDMDETLKKLNKKFEDSDNESDQGWYSSEEDSSIDSDNSQSWDSEESDESENEGAAGLEALLSTGRKLDKEAPKHQRGKLLIYDMISGTATPVFRFEQSFPAVIYNSPPVFHPTANLAVWPLGGGEVLFANFTNNAFYTRTLRCSASKSCHVSVQAQFSPDGQYLHIGALEAREAPTAEKDEEDDDDDDGPQLQFTFQLSTHRLSSSKTARSPPRLIFRTAVPLGYTGRISVAPLPYTLTWSSNHVYVTESNREMRVFRVPLFRSDQDPNPASHVSSGPIFLPNSSAHRKVQYFPPRPDAKDKDLAKVIVGSFSPRPIGGPIVPRHAISPPLGFYLGDEKDLGPWKRIDEMCEVDKHGKRTALGGRLHAKFEKFDRNEDCDIVPYMF